MHMEYIVNKINKITINDISYVGTPLCSYWAVDCLVGVLN